MEDISEFWNEIYLSQKDIENSDDCYDDEDVISAYLDSIMAEALSIEGISKHFESWLLKKTKGDN